MLPQTPSQELCSWKEIAAYLNVSVKTAQLWEQQRGMPVRRLPGPRGQVRALTSELDAWKVSIPEPLAVEAPVPVPVDRNKQVLRWGAVALLAATIGSVAIFYSARPTLASIRLEIDALSAVDDKGNLLWRQTFEHLNLRPYSVRNPKIWLGDIEGDGKKEVLFIPTSEKEYQSSTPILCMNESGEELWKYTASKDIRRGRNGFDDFYAAKQFVVVGQHIVVASHHGLYYPAQIAVLDSKGKLLREYWHPGHLNTMIAGKYKGKSVAFLGGVNNVRKLATLVVLDPENLGGAAMEDGQPCFDGMQPGAEEARILLPRSKLYPESPYSVAFQLASSKAGLTAHVRESFENQVIPTLLFHFRPDLTVDEVSPSDLFHTNFRKKFGRDWSSQDEAELKKVLVLSKGSD